MEQPNKMSNNSIIFMPTFVSDNQRQLFAFVNCIILCGVISVFGTVFNIINLVIFYRQGLNTTINISFFSLAVSDLCNLFFQQLFNVYINPLFKDLNLPIAYTDLQYLTTAVKREMFARITSLITAYITAERCMCVVFPLHVKQMITPKRTIIIIIIIYAFTLLSPLPYYCTTYIAWNFSPGRNRTILGLAHTRYKDITEATIYFTHGFFTFVSFFGVVAFTGILIYKLGQKNVFRDSTKVDHEKTTSMTKKDRTTIFMVVLIATTLVVCYTPAVALCITTVTVPGFSVGGRHYNVYYCVWTFAFLFETINSSVNIFLYYKMSTKYRQAFKELFSGYLSR